MELKKHGVSLISVLEYLDDESPESLILESVLEAMAEYYSKNLAREVNKGMKENALKGLHTGGLPPLGYDLDPKTKMLVINQKEAEAVRLTFKMFNEGYGYGKIIDELNHQGYKSKVGKSFRSNSLSNVVRNEKYFGDALLQKTYTVDFLSKKRVVNNGIVLQYYVENSHEAIILRNLYMQVQDELVRRTNLHSGKNHSKWVYSLKYASSSLVYCSECGEIYRRVTWNN